MSYIYKPEGQISLMPLDASRNYSSKCIDLQVLMNSEHCTNHKILGENFLIPPQYELTFKSCHLFMCIVSWPRALINV